MAAISRASETMAGAGAQVIFDAVSGDRVSARYWRVRSNTGRAWIFVPSASVTSKEPSSAGSMFRAVK